MAEVSVSLLSLKKENAIQTLYNLETAGVDYFHVDVMDGEFAKNNTVDRMLEYCECLNSISNLPLDVHLMVNDVKNYILSFAVFEPNIITFHLEAAKNKEEAIEWIKLIKENNIRVGVSVKPDTKIEEIKDLLPYIHLVLVMTVEPGKGGQELIPKTVEKVKALKKYVDDNNLEIDIEVDGGINQDTAKTVKDAGANMLAVGSYILNSENYADVVERLKNS